MNSQTKYPEQTNSNGVQLISLNPKVNNGFYNLQSLAIKGHAGVEIIPFDEIAYCQADGNYSKIFKLHGSSSFVSKTLKDIERQLPGHLFIRVHHSFIVALHAIRFINVDHTIQLSNNEIIPFSRRHKSIIFRRFGV